MLYPYRDMDATTLERHGDAGVARPQCGRHRRRDAARWSRRPTSSCGSARSRSRSTSSAADEHSAAFGHRHVLGVSIQPIGEGDGARPVGVAALGAPRLGGDGASVGSSSSSSASSSASDDVSAIADELRRRPDSRSGTNSRACGSRARRVLVAEVVDEQAHVRAHRVDHDAQRRRVRDRADR